APRRRARRQRDDRIPRRARRRRQRRGAQRTDHRRHGERAGAAHLAVPVHRGAAREAGIEEQPQVRELLRIASRYATAENAEFAEQQETLRSLRAPRLLPPSRLAWSM